MGNTVSSEKSRPLAFTLAPILAFVISLTVYLFTIAPGLLQIDSGELAAVQNTLGLAHATGYPIFTILGYFFQQIPLGLSPVYQSNLLSAIWCASAVALVVQTVIYIFSEDVFFKSKPEILPLNAPQTIPETNKLKGHGKKMSASAPATQTASVTSTTVQPPKPLSEWGMVIAALSAALTLAFSRTFWFQSTGVEVYSLHVLMLSLIMYYLLQAYVKNTSSSWLILAGVLGLSFGNHMTTVVMGPGIAWLYFSKKNFGPDAWKTLGTMLLLFFAVLVTEYSYLPLRANENPAINWGNPNTWDRFWYHVLGKQYQVWVFSGSAVTKRQLAHLFKSVGPEFAWIGLLASLSGIAIAFQKSKVLAVWLVINTLTCILFAINYDIVDIDAYFLAAFIMLGLSVAWLISYLWQLRPVLALAIMLIIPSAQIIANYKVVNQSDNFTFDDYTRNILEGVEDDAIILSRQWDYFVAPSLYYQQVLKLKPKVAIVDKELVRRSWYFNQLENNYPTLIAPLKPEIEKFKILLIPFEANGNFDANGLQTIYVHLFTAIIENNFGRHPVYISPELIQVELQNKELVIPAGLTIVPVGALFKVVQASNTAYQPSALKNTAIRLLPRGRNNYADMVGNIMLQNHIWRASYEMQYQKPNEAKKLVKLAREIDPTVNLPLDLASLK